MKAAASFDPGLVGWLGEQNISLVLSTYRANRLLFIGVGLDGQLKIHERLFDRPMGLFNTEQSLWMAGRSHLWRFDNLLNEGQTYEGADRLYAPAASFLTGEVNAHELVVLENTKPLFVNTVFSCLAELETGLSFKPVWQPPFIDALVPEDRCHLNGLALHNGSPIWATACCSDNAPTSWRQQRVGGGVMIHIPTGEIICSGLTMPHSPRWHEGRLWVLNSGRGELGWVESGCFYSLCELPGFIRGLAFSNGCAVVGLSKLRSSVFTGLPLEEKLSQVSDSQQGICGLRVVDLNSGCILHSLDLPEPIDELFDVAVLPNVREPLALGLKDESIDCLVKLPQVANLVQIRPKTPSDPSQQDSAVARLGLPQQEHDQQINTPSKLQYQCVYQLTPATLAPYSALTFPPLTPGSNALQHLSGELLGVAANHKGLMVGLVIAERNDQGSAVVVSLMVSPEWRHQGIGTRLVAYLGQLLSKEGVQQLTVRYQAPLNGLSVMSRLLKRLHWREPQEDFLLLKGQSDQLAAINWPDRFPLPEGYAIHPWVSSYAKETANIDAPAELRDGLTSPSIEPSTSMSLIHQGQLVGWIIADRIHPKAVRYSSYFVEPSHRRRGQGLHLLAAAFRRQHDASIPIARAALSPANKAMLRLTKRHLHPHLSAVNRSLHSGVQLMASNVSAPNTKDF